MSKKYMPYGFDFKYEYVTYKNIGTEEKVEYKAKSVFGFRCLKIIRENRNKNEKKYKRLKNYSEWKEYILEKNSKYLGSEDYIHFLRSKARESDYSQSIIGSILIPTYMVMMSGGLTLLLLPTQQSYSVEMVAYAWLCFSILIIILLSYLLRRNYKRNNAKHFYLDYIEIMRG